MNIARSSARHGMSKLAAAAALGALALSSGGAAQAYQSPTAWVPKPPELKGRNLTGFHFALNIVHRDEFVTTPVGALVPNLQLRVACRGAGGDRWEDGFTAPFILRTSTRYVQTGTFNVTNLRWGIGIINCRLDMNTPPGHRVAALSGQFIANQDTWSHEFYGSATV